MEAFPRELCLDLNTFWSISMIYEHLALSINIHVDDSTIFEICNQSRVSGIQDSADIIAQWSIDNDMRINTSKTMVICFCKDRTYVESLPYIDINGTDINGTEKVAKARKRVCMIYQLKCAGINKIDLVRIYVSVIRPVVEYVYPVWHTNLPKYLSDNIEILKKRCLKTIFSGFTCDDILQMVNIPTLHDRRNEICKAYFGRMRRGDYKLNKLLPDTRMVSYTLRSFNELPVPMANTNRHKNS